MARAQSKVLSAAETKAAKAETKLAIAAAKAALKEANGKLKEHAKAGKLIEKEVAAAQKAHDKLVPAAE